MYIICPQVGADGSKSQVRKLANLSTIDWNYDQHAVVATLILDQVGIRTLDDGCF